MPLDEEGEAPLNESAAVEAKRRRTRPAGDHRRRCTTASGGTWRPHATRLLFTPPPQAVTEDVGEIAVVQDEGDLLTAPNSFDLRGVGLRFTRNGSAYDVTRTDAAFRPDLGTRVTLEDDDSVSFTLPFTFAFYDRTQPLAFVNSDGNITFEEEDRASTERNVTRVMTGPPRVAPFFADLDPIDRQRPRFRPVRRRRVYGHVLRRSRLRQNETVTVQSQPAAQRRRRGEVRPAHRARRRDRGLSPGRTGGFAPLDLSTAGHAYRRQRRRSGSGLHGAGTSTSSPPRASSTSRIRMDTISWSSGRTSAVTDEAFAFETTIANEIRGIGLDVFDQSRAFGSAGRLRSIVMMDTLGQVPGGSARAVPRREQHAQSAGTGERASLAGVPEVPGSRWTAIGRAARARRGALELLHGLGCVGHGGQRHRRPRRRRLPHGRGRAAVQQRSTSTRWVSSPRIAGRRRSSTSRARSTSPRRATARMRPASGVTFNGTKRTVLLQDVVPVMGARQPPPGRAPRIPAGVHLRARRTARTADHATDRQDRPDSPRVGGLLRAGRQESCPRRDPAASTVVTRNAASQDSTLRTCMRLTCTVIAGPLVVAHGRARPGRAVGGAGAGGAPPPAAATRHLAHLDPLVEDAIASIGCPAPLCSRAVPRDLST